MTTKPLSVVDRLGGPALLFWHKKFGLDTSVEEYISKYKTQIHRGMAQTKVVYLDTNYWIWLRDAEMGKGTTEAVALLERLRSLVANRKVICVSHLTSMLEIAKQIEESARVSAALVDELTERLALAPVAELDAIEVENYIRAKSGEMESSAARQWTCLGLIMNSEILSSRELPKGIGGDGRAVLKSTADALWNSGFSEIFLAFDWNTKYRLPSDLSQETLDQTEARKKTTPHNRNLQKTRYAEFSGTMKSNTKLFETELLKLIEPLGTTVLGEKISFAAAGFARIAGEDYQKNALDSHLPGFVIRNELYSLYECDPSHKLTNNDWKDWQHASVAIPYCDMFFTEKRLADQVKNKFHHDTRYGCRVVGSDINSALALLDEHFT